MFKNVILKFAVALLVAAFAVGETCADEGSAPINPAFLKWRKDRKRKPVKPVSDGQKSRKLLASAPQTAEGELGLAPSVFDSSYLANLNIMRTRGVGVTYPSKYDLREQGWLTPIRDQNPYGTCWTFATFSSMESSLLKFEGQAFDFSENNLANLHGGDWGYDDGGNADLASAYLLRWDGPVLESSDSYPNPGGSRVLTPVRHVQNVPWVAGKTTYLDNDGIKDAIVKYGALWAGYYHEGSCYYSAKSSYYFPYFFTDGRRHVNHAVAVVGWDDNYSRYNFIDTPPENGAYIVRNNWGAYWGDGGYFYVSYFDETFAWNTLYSFSNVEAVDNYSAIYQYDPLGLVNSIGLGGSSAWGANMFKATTSDPISAVGFYAMAPGTAYKIFIYTGCATGNPCSGTLKLTQSGTSETAGYLTIPLSQSVGVTKDAMFSVVLQLTTSGYYYPLAIEYAVDGYSSGATASEGQSYYSSRGDVWVDFADAHNFPYANFCCKAYAKANAAPVKVLASIGVDGISSLTSGKSAQFTCKAKYSDGSEADVTDRVTWSIADGRTYASVSSSGLVTAKEVDAQQTVKVHAKYTEGSVTKENDWSFYVTVAAPQPPTGLTATEGTDASCIRVNWTAPSGASSYAVYRSASSSSGSAKFLEPVTITRYADTDESLVPGVDYWYFIKAKNDSGTSGYSEGVRGWRKLSAPENVSATDGTSLDNVTITWSEVKGAKYYRVYRSAEDETEAEAKPLGTGWQTATKYVDSTAQAGVTYLYYVKAAINGNGDRPSDLGIFDDGFRSVPVTLDSISIDGAASIAAGGSATYTCTATYTDKSTKPVSPTWEIVGGSQFVTQSGATLTAKPTTGNQVVTLKATYTDGVKRTANKSITITAVKPSAPKTVTLKGATTEGVSISWTSVSGASAYSVWRGTSTANAKKIADALTGTEYTDVSGEPGVAYTYWVKASNAAGESAFSTGSVTGTRLLSAPTGVVASDGTFTDKTTVTWKAAPGATHYRVARAESQTGTKTELGSWQTVVSYSDANGTAGKRYWYFVKAATSGSGANASAYGAGDEGWRKVSVTLSSIAIGGVAKLAAGASTVFSCTATYSDGTSRTVTPTWSASGSGTIDASGKFTAAAVTVDSTATVTARYTDGTSKTATHEVKIVVPVKATAEIASVKPSTRWPFSGKLDVDYELKTTPDGTRALVSLSGFDNDKQTPMAAKTLSGDGAEGAVAAGKHRLTWDVAADYPNFRSSSFGIDLVAVPVNIFPPTEVSATSDSSSGKITLVWSPAEDAAGYEVWRGTSASIAAAEKIGAVSTVSFPDGTVVAGVTYYYWVRSVGEGGDVSEFSDGVTAKTNPTTYTICFDANGGSGSMSSLPMVYGTAKNLPANTFKPPHEIRKFAGWALLTSGGVVYGDGESVNNLTTVNGGVVTLYAVWELQSVNLMPLKSVLAVLKSGSIGGNLTAAIVDAALNNPTLVDMDGDTTRVSDLERAVLLEVRTMLTDKYEDYEYICSGQYDLISDDDLFAYDDMSRVIENMKAVQEDGRFDLLGYTIVFKRNYGDAVEGYTQTKAIAFGNRHPKLMANGYSRTNCEFLGWATSSTGAVVYEDGADLTKISKPSGGTLTLYAIWKVVRVTVSFNANGGSGTMTNETVKTGSTYVIPTSKFKRTDYAFQGWATSSSGGVVCADGATIPSLSADLVLYAIWKSNFVLTGSVNGWTISLSWNNVSGAAKYKVYRRKMGWSVLSTELSDCEYIGETTKTTYTDTLTSVSTAGLRLNYYVGYIVVAVNAQGTTMKYTALRTFAIKTN